MRPWRLSFLLTATASLMVLTSCTGPAIIGPPRRGPPPPAETRSHGVVVTRTDVIAPMLQSFPGGFWVRSPCFNTVAIWGGRFVEHADVVLDAGHGGPEPGAIGPNGLPEREPNLAVSLDARQQLTDQGVRVVPTRTRDDYFLTIRTRAEIARALDPDLLVSIHHNAVGPTPRKGRPGTEQFHQANSAASRRLAGALYDEVTTALSRYDIAWSADDNNPGPKFREGDNGDYYGILRYAAGTPAVISEAAYLSNPAEADLLATTGFRHTEATAIVAGIRRFRDEPNPSQDTDPAPPATFPTNPPTDGVGCVDPAMY